VCPPGTASIPNPARFQIEQALVLLRHPERFVPSDPSKASSELEQRSRFKKIGALLREVQDLLYGITNAQHLLADIGPIGFERDDDLREPGHYFSPTEYEMLRKENLWLLLYAELDDNSKEAWQAEKALGWLVVHRLMAKLARNAEFYSEPFLSFPPFKGASQTSYPRLMGLRSLIVAWFLMGGKIARGYDPIADQPSGPLIRFLRATTDILLGSDVVPLTALDNAIKRAQRAKAKGWY
jgi:hypothetical protein